MKIVLAFNFKPMIKHLFLSKQKKNQNMSPKLNLKN